jgi:hypothetical protein
MQTEKVEILDTKEEVFNELGISSEKELSNESVFRKLISLDAKIDKEVLGMILSKIDNFAELITTQQTFISDMAEKQKQLDVKALDSFNKTKEIISEILKANPTMDKDIMIYLIDSLKEMDRLISSHANEGGKRIERLIKAGLAVGGVVGAAIIAITFKGGGNGGGGKA